MTVQADETPSKVSKKPSAVIDNSATPSHTPAHVNQWDATPGRKDPGSETPAAVQRMWDPTPAHTTPGRDPTSAAMTPGGRRNRWDETPRTERDTSAQNAGWAETPRTDRGPSDKIIISETPTPGASKRRSRWDETPGATPLGGATPLSGAMTPGHATPGGATPSMTPGGMTPSAMTPSAATPMGMKAMDMATPSPAQMMQMTPEQLQAFRWEKEIDDRNRPLSDEELDSMFPPGYKVLQPPAGYVPIR